MYCRQIKKRLSAYLDNELPIAACHPLEEHLRSCAFCRTAWFELQALSEAMRERSAAIPGDDFVSSVMRRLPLSRPRTSWRPLPLLAYSLVFVAFAVLGFMLAISSLTMPATSKPYAALTVDIEHALAENRSLNLISVQEQTLKLLQSGGTADAR